MMDLMRHRNLVSLIKTFLERPYSWFLVKVQDGVPVHFRELKTSRDKSKRS